MQISNLCDDDFPAAAVVDGGGSVSYVKIDECNYAFNFKYILQLANRKELRKKSINRLIIFFLY